MAAAAGMAAQLEPLLQHLQHEEQQQGGGEAAETPAARSARGVLLLAALQTALWGNQADLSLLVRSNGWWFKERAFRVCHFTTVRIRCDVLRPLHRPMHHHPPRCNTGRNIAACGSGRCVALALVCARQPREDRTRHPMHMQGRGGDIPALRTTGGVAFAEAMALAPLAIGGAPHERTELCLPLG